MWFEFSGAILISLLHGLIPSHWLPVVALGKKHNWSQGRVLRVALLAAVAHSLSTVLIGLAVALFGHYLSSSIEWFTRLAPAILLSGLGLWFIYRHYTHHHFHLQPKSREHSGIVWPLLLAMFLSPCMEIEGYFFLAGTHGWGLLALLSVTYVSLSVASIFLWVYIAWKGATHINAHRWEHSSGILTGIVLLLSGLLFLLD
ncbi:MAG: hypothetical protein JNL57_04485 [Bacteroidetes bacterium]|nr:hypothetical protein [Bacteroidota bacterium]